MSCTPTDPAESTRLHEVQRPRLRVGRYVAPETLDQALELLSEHGERARVVAGGTDLLIELDRNIGPQTEVLVDLTRLADLNRIHQEPDAVHLGPSVTHNQVAGSPLLRKVGLPLVQACLEIGAPALRNRATVVGNVVTASPANDTISALRALDATVHLASLRAVRSVPLALFHTGVRRSVLAPDEIVTGISFPPLAVTDRGLFLKLGLRRSQAISVVHVAVVVRFAEDDPSSAVTSARIAVGSVAPTVIRCPEAEAALVGAPLDATRLAAAAQAAVAAVDPIDDLRAGADYRREQVGFMVGRALSAIRRGEERSGLGPPPPMLGGPTIDGDGHAVDARAGSQITGTVNGEAIAAPWSDGTLLDWLRAEAGLTGTKEGCAEGECGACTVHLDGVAVLSCLVPAGRADGASIVTIEGLADDDGGRSLQRRFVECAAVQCGYCIPGFLMAGAKLIAEVGPAGPDDAQLKSGLSGNLCRCTGYYKIEEAFSLGWPAAPGASESHPLGAHG